MGSSCLGAEGAAASRRAPHAACRDPRPLPLLLVTPTRAPGLAATTTTGQARSRRRHIVGPHASTTAPPARHGGQSASQRTRRNSSVCWPVLGREALWRQAAHSTVCVHLEKKNTPCFGVGGIVVSSAKNR